MLVYRTALRTKSAAVRFCSQSLGGAEFEFVLRSKALPFDVFRGFLQKLLSLPKYGLSSLKRPPYKAFLTPSRISHVQTIVRSKNYKHRTALTGIWNEIVTLFYSFRDVLTSIIGWKIASDIIFTFSIWKHYLTALPTNSQGTSSCISFYISNRIIIVIFTIPFSTSYYSNRHSSTNVHKMLLYFQ